MERSEAIENLRAIVLGHVEGGNRTIALDAIAVLDAPDPRDALLKEARETINLLIDTEECRYDHHGNCQTHGVNNPCEVALARALLDRLPKEGT